MKGFFFLLMLMLMPTTVAHHKWDLDSGSYEGELSAPSLSYPVTTPIVAFHHLLRN